jgi:hypothetical protein
MKFLRFLLLLSLVLFTTSSNAGSGGVPPSLFQQADEKNLAQHPYWQKLLHYKRATGSATVTSDIVANEFFLSPLGNHDPGQELQATLRAFFEPVASDADQHAQCRFVARFQWLREMLDWRGADPPIVSCPRFERWSAHGSISSVSVIFATGYFSNPASYYGHILLRFNSEQGTEMSGLLDQTLNFGAIVPEGEPGLVYVAKGLFGGYEAAFTSVQFYRHNHNYAEDELRDMWAYELSLTKQEVARLVAHGWELLHARFDYYFANENCAYRMSELLGLVVDEPMVFESLPWSAPGSVFDHLVELKKDGKPLVRKVSLIPSRLNRFHAQYRMLDGVQKNMLQDWTSETASFESAAYISLDDGRKSAVVDALVDYVEFRRVREPTDSFAAKSRRALLLERVKLPSRTQYADIEATAGGVPHQTPPHTGPRPNMVRLGVLSNDRLGHGVSLTLRPAYFDRLSIDDGRIPNATLSMFEIELARFEQRVRLRRLDIVNLEHMNIAETPLPEDGGYAWRIKFGVQDQDLSCAGCIVGKVGGGLGKAALLGEQTVGFVMLGGNLQTPHAGSGSAVIDVAVGVTATPLSSWKTNVELGRNAYLNGDRARGWTTKWQNRLGGNRNWDVRLNFEHNVVNQWHLEYSAYW